MSVLRAENLRLSLREGRRQRILLDIDSLSLEAGQSLAVSGPSGGGKTTLLHVLAGLLPPSAGRIFWDEKDIYALPESRRDALRAGTAGMIFQDFQLMPGLNALDNILLPLTFRGWRASPSRRREAADLLDRLDIGAPCTRVEKLSRGEMQRVALGRAFMNDCRLLFADEPTASLDAANSRQVADLLRGLCRERHSTLVCVTHDARLMDGLDRCLRLEQGRLREAA